MFKQKKQAGNYWDTFLLLDFDYDKKTKNLKLLMVLDQCID